MARLGYLISTGNTKFNELEVINQVLLKSIMNSKEWYIPNGIKYYM